MAFPVRNAFRRLETLAELASIPAHRVRGSTADAPSPVALLRFELVRPGRFQPQPKTPTPIPASPTDFCNRQRAWAHRRTVASLRTEPAVSAHSVVPVKAGTANGTTSGADAPCARGQGRHRPAAPRVSLHDGSHRGPLASDVPSTSSSFAARCSRIWCREQTSLEPRPDSIRRANGEDLRQAEVLSIPGNPHGS
jgi:hypothetical protein